MDMTMLTKLLDLFKTFLGFIGYGDEVEEGEAKFNAWLDLIKSNIKPLD